MQNIKKQLGAIYAYSFTSCLKITTAVWVVLLSARGFSLWQIGLSEGIFHITSLLCEVPSGMASDLIGRRRSLALSGVLGAVSAIAMVSGGSFFWVCLSMVFSALSYNMISGTLEAITYDSLVKVNRSGEYLQVDANSSILQNFATLVSDLCSLLSGVLSYVGFYLLDALISLSRCLAALQMSEPAVTEKQAARQKAPFADLPRRFKAHVADSFGFFIRNPRIARKIMADAAIALPDYLTLMFLQERLTELGFPSAFLGLPLMLLGATRMLATMVARRLKPRSLLCLYAVCALGTGIGVILAGAAPMQFAIAGAMLLSASIEIWYLHCQKSLNDAYPSDQRATLVSVNSMAHSVLMIAASPLVGAISDMAGTAGAGLCVLGAMIAALGAIAGILAFRRKK